MNVAGIDHVQIAMPAGREAEARAFYSGLLGIPEVEKPKALAGRGGVWFEHGGVRVHLGVDPDFRPARKAHPAFVVHGLPALARRLRDAAVEVVEDDALPGRTRLYVADPFGNRVELVDAGIDAGAGRAVRLFRVILPVPSIDAAARFYSTVLDAPGRRVSGGRHYFEYGPTILACFSALEDGDPEPVPPNPEHLYFAVDDLEGVRERCLRAGGRDVGEVATRPWGERSFYLRDPFDNKLCFVDETTAFTGG